jgi:hypothetical protein
MKYSTLGSEIRDEENKPQLRTFGCGEHGERMEDNRGVGGCMSTSREMQGQKSKNKKTKKQKNKKKTTRAGKNEVQVAKYFYQSDLSS